MGDRQASCLIPRVDNLRNFVKVFAWNSPNHLAAVAISLVQVRVGKVKVKGAERTKSRLIVPEVEKVLESSNGAEVSGFCCENWKNAY